MKKFFTGLLLAIVSIAAVAFAGCAASPKETMKFTDFKAYKSFNSQVAGVYFTDILDSGKYVQFTIEDEDTVNNILSYYQNAEFKYGGSNRYVGCNMVLHFVYDNGKELSVNLASIYEDGHSYLYNDGLMQDIVREIERDKGVFPSETLKFKQFTKYSDFDENVSVIYLNRHSGDCIIIEDKEDIKTIVNQYLNTEFKIYYGEQNKGEKDSLDFYYEKGERVNVDLNELSEGGYVYRYADDLIRQTIEKICSDKESV